MDSGEKERLILANVEKDSCLDGQVEVAFFKRLAACGRPASSGEAGQFAFNVVLHDPDRFVCQGRNVPEDLFVSLFRLQRVSLLGYALPPSLLDSIGYEDRAFWDDIAEEDLRSVTDEFDGQVQVGNRLKVVWVTDFADIADRLTDLSSLVNSLGLEEDRYVLCSYNREDAGRTLHVPRAIDAIDQPLFQVVDDPNADHGWTGPTDGRVEERLPEAVHRNCKIVPRQWQLGKR